MMLVSPPSSLPSTTHAVLSFPPYLVFSISQVTVREGKVGYQLQREEASIFVTVEDALTEVFKKLAGSVS